ncbi:MAG: hypothetical protein GX786_02625 [Clostridiales bacterium]|nr:hypothetical protein [Clostridiales bacterium]
MKMKKWILWITLFALSLSSIVAFAKEEEPSVLFGRVVTINPNSLVVETAFDNEMVVHLDENTLVEAENPLAFGDYITIVYSGAVATSLPPQIYAQTIRCTKIQGEVLSYQSETDSITIENPIYGKIVVHLSPNSLSVPKIGTTVVVYYSGAMTRSIPPQISAQHLAVYAKATGEIHSVKNNTFTLTLADGTLLQVHYIPEETSIIGSLQEKILAEVLYIPSVFSQENTPIQASQITLSSEDPEASSPAADNG